MASVRVVETAFGNGLVAARDFEAGETVLTEQPGFLLVDGAAVTCWNFHTASATGKTTGRRERSQWPSP